MRTRHNFNPPKLKKKNKAIIYCCLNRRIIWTEKQKVRFEFSSPRLLIDSSAKKERKGEKKAERRCQELEKPGKHLPTSWQRTDTNALSEQLHNGTCSLPGVVYQTHLELVPCALFFFFSSSCFYIFILSGLFLDMTASCQKQHMLGFGAFARLTDPACSFKTCNNNSNNNGSSKIRMDAVCLWTATCADTKMYLIHLVFARQVNEEHNYLHFPCCVLSCSGE